MHPRPDTDQPGSPAPPDRSAVGGPPLVRTDGPSLGRVAAVVLVGALVVVAVVVLAFLAYRARQALLLAFTGFFLAVGFEPGVGWLIRHGVRRGLGVALTALGLVAVGAVLTGVLIVPGLRQLGALIQEAPQLLDRLSERFGGPATSAGAALADPVTHAQVSQVSEQFGQVLVSALTAVFSALGLLLGGAAAALTTLVLMVYFGLAMPRIRASLARLLARSDRVRTLDQALGRVGGYISGQILVSLIAGAMSFVFFLLAGVPYPALLAVVVALSETRCPRSAPSSPRSSVQRSPSRRAGPRGRDARVLLRLSGGRELSGRPARLLPHHRPVPARGIRRGPRRCLARRLAGDLIALPVTAAGKIVLARLLIGRPDQTT